MPLSAELSLSAATDHRSADLDQSVQPRLEVPPSTNDVLGLPDDATGEGAATNNDGVVKGDEWPGNRRSHGSAVPRWESKYSCGRLRSS